MSVIDASLWVSVCHAADRHHRSSTAWLESMLVAGTRLRAPALLQVEVGAAIRRLTGDQALGQAAVDAIEGFSALDLVALTRERGRRAAEIATVTGVRGADAVYLELAADRGEVLVTWDRRQLEQGASVARVETP